MKSYKCVLLGAAEFPTGARCIQRPNAQAITAGIPGKVTGASTAVIPEATVQIRNVETGVLRTAISGAQGRHSIPDLSYELHAPEFVAQGLGEGR